MKSRLDMCGCVFTPEMRAVINGELAAIEGVEVFDGQALFQSEDNPDRYEVRHGHDPSTRQAVLKILESCNVHSGRWSK